MSAFETPEEPPNLDKQGLYDMEADNFRKAKEAAKKKDENVKAIVAGKAKEG